MDPRELIQIVQPIQTEEELQSVDPEQIEAELLNYVWYSKK